MHDAAGVLAVAVGCSWCAGGLWDAAGVLVVCCQLLCRTCRAAVAIIMFKDHAEEVEVEAVATLSMLRDGRLRFLAGSPRRG